MSGHDYERESMAPSHVLIEPQMEHHQQKPLVLAGPDATTTMASGQKTCAPAESAEARRAIRVDAPATTNLAAAHSSNCLLAGCGTASHNSSPVSFKSSLAASASPYQSSCFNCSASSNDCGNQRTSGGCCGRNLVFASPIRIRIGSQSNKLASSRNLALNSSDSASSKCYSQAREAPQQQSGSYHDLLTTLSSSQAACPFAATDHHLSSSQNISRTNSFSHFVASQSSQAAPPSITMAPPHLFVKQYQQGAPMSWSSGVASHDIGDYRCHSKRAKNPKVLLNDNDESCCSTPQAVESGEREEENYRHENYHHLSSGPVVCYSRLPAAVALCTSGDNQAATTKIRHSTTSCQLATSMGSTTSGGGSVASSVGASSIIQRSHSRFSFWDSCMLNDAGDNYQANNNNMTRSSQLLIEGASHSNEADNQATLSSLSTADMVTTRAAAAVGGAENLLVTSHFQHQQRQHPQQASWLSRKR